MHKDISGDKVRDYENIGQRSTSRVDNEAEVNTSLPMTPPAHHRSSGHSLTVHRPNNANSATSQQPIVSPNPDLDQSTSSSVTIVEVNHRRGGRGVGEVSTQTSISLERGATPQPDGNVGEHAILAKEVSTQVSEDISITSSGGLVNRESLTDQLSTPNTSMTSSSLTSGFEENPRNSQLLARTAVEQLFPMVREQRVIRKASAQRTQSVKESSNLLSAGDQRQQAVNQRKPSARVQRSVSVQRPDPQNGGSSQIRDGRWRFFSDDVFLERGEPASILNHTPSHRYNHTSSRSSNHTHSNRDDTGASLQLREHEVSVEYSPGMEIYDRNGNAVVLPDQLSPRYHSTASLYASPVYEEEDQVPGSSGSRTRHDTTSRHAVRRQVSMPMKQMKAPAVHDATVRGYSTLARATVQGHPRDHETGNTVRRRYSDARHGDRRLISRRPQSSLSDVRHYVHDSRHVSHDTLHDARHYSSAGNLHPGSQATLTVHGPGLIDSAHSQAIIQNTPISAPQVTVR